MNLTNKILSLLALILLSGCFGSENESASANTFGLSLELVEKPEFVTAGSVENIIRVRLTDSKGRAASNFDVIFTAQGSSDLVVEGTIASTNEDGVASSSFRAPSSVLENQKITISVRDLSIEYEYIFDVITGGPPFPTSIKWGITPDSQYSVSLADAMPTFRADVYDQYGELYQPDLTDEEPDPAVNVSISLGLGNASFLSGTLQKGLSNSTASFSDVFYRRAETITLKANLLIDGINIRSITRNIEVLAGFPSKIAVLAPGEGLNSGFLNEGSAFDSSGLNFQRAGVQFSSDVYILDEFHNIVTEFVVPPYSSAINPAPNATIDNQGALTNGRAVLKVTPKIANASLTIDPSGTFNSSSLAVRSTPSIDIKPGVPNKLSIRQQPDTEGMAGVALTRKFQVDVEDVFGNFIDDATNAISAKAYSDPTCDTEVLDPGRLKNGQITAAAGVGSFDSLNYELDAVIYLKAFSPGLASTVCSEGIDIDPGPVATIEWAQIPTSEQKAGVAMTATPKVQASDLYGNLVSDGSAINVEIKLFTDDQCDTEATGTAPSGAPLKANQTAPTNAGFATFTGFNIRRIGSYHLQATDNGGASEKTTACSSAIAVAADDPDALEFVNSVPTTHNAQNAFSNNIVLKLVDQWGNINSGSTENVSINIFESGGCTTPKTVTLENNSISNALGIYDFAAANLRLRTAGTMRLGATLGSGAVPTVCASLDTVVSAGVAAKMTWKSVFTTTVSIKNGFSPVPSVQITDTWGNDVDAAQTITLAVHTDAGCNTAAETQTPSGVDAIPAGTNIENSNVNGLATFSDFAYNRARSIYLSANSGGLTKLCTTNPIELLADNPQTLVQTNSLPTGDIGAHEKITAPVLKITDEWGNSIKSGYSISLEARAGSTSCAATPPATRSLENASGPLSNGTVSFSSLYYREAEEIDILAETDASGVADICLGTVNIVPGPASKLAFNSQPATGPTPADQNFSDDGVDVIITDDWNNRVVDSQKVALRVHEAANCNGSPSSAEFLGGTATDTVAGVSTFSSLFFRKTASVLRLEAFVDNNSDGTPDSDSLDSACSDNFQITHGPAYKIRYLSGTDPISGNKKVGVNWPGFDLEVVDAWNNRFTSGGAVTMDVEVFTDATCETLHESSTTTPEGQPKISYGAISTISGVASVSSLNYRLTGEGLYFGIDSGNTTITESLCSNSFTSISDTATKIIWSQSPGATGHNADAPLNNNPILNLKDIYGNLLTEVKSVQIQTYTDALCTSMTSPVVENATKDSNQNGNVNFGNYTIRTAETYYLRAIVGGVDTLTDSCLGNSVTVDPGAVAKLAYTVDPTNGDAGISLTTQPSIEIYDAHDNLATNSADLNVDFSLHTDSSCTAGSIVELAPDASTDAVTYDSLLTSSGTATSSNLTVNAAGDELYIAAYLSSNSSVRDCSQSIIIKGGTPAEITAPTFTFASPLKADTAFTFPIFSLKDIYGNPTVGVSRTVELIPYDDSACTSTPSATGPIEGNRSKASSTGTFNFSGQNIFYTLSGAVIYWRAQWTGDPDVNVCLPSSTTIIPGDPSVIEFTAQPVNGDAGVALTTQPTVELRDSKGNVVSNSQGVTLTPMTTNDSTCVSGTTLANDKFDYTDKGTTSFNAGSFTSSGFNITKKSEGMPYRIKATSGLIKGCSTSFTIAPGPANDIAITSTLPSNYKASNSFNLTAEIRDQYGNIINSASGYNLVAEAFPDGSGCTGAPSTAVLPSTANSPGASAYNNNSVAVSTGNVTFSNFAYRLSGTYEIGVKASNGSLTAACSASNAQDLTVKAASPNKVSFPSLFNSPVATNADDVLSNVDFSVYDPFGNLNDDASYQIDLELRTWNTGCDTDPGAATQALLAHTPGNLATSGGVARADSLDFRASGQWGLLATVNGFASTATCSDNPINVSPGAPDKLRWSEQPSVSGSLTAGVDLNGNGTLPVVFVADQYGNFVGASGSGKSIDLVAYDNGGCTTPSSTVTNPMANGTTVANLTSAFEVTGTTIAGTSTATSLLLKKSGTYYFKASASGLTETPCSTSIEITPDSFNFLRIRSEAGNNGFEIQDGEDYVNTYPTFFSAGYDQFGNFIGDHSVAWTLYTTAAPGTPLSAATLSNTSGVQATVTSAAGAGRYNIKAVSNSNGTKTKQLNNFGIILETPASFLVTLDPAPSTDSNSNSINDYLANQDIQLTITAKAGAGGTGNTVTSFQGQKAIRFTHNNGTTEVKSGCGGSYTQSFPTQAILFSSGVGRISTADGNALKLKKAMNGVWITATNTTGTSFAGTSNTFEIAPDSATTCLRIVDVNGAIIANNAGLSDQQITAKLGNVDSYANFVGFESAFWESTGSLFGLLQGNPDEDSLTTSLKRLRRGSATLIAKLASDDSQTASVDLSLTADPSDPTWTSATVVDGSSLLNSNSVKAVRVFDAFDPAINSFDNDWKYDNTKSWYLENAVTNIRSSKREFPNRVMLIGTEFGLDFIDMTTHKLWMRANSGLGNMIDSAKGRPVSIAAGERKIFIAQRNSVGSAGAFLLIDFKRDRVLRFTASGVQSRDIAGRNTGSWTSEGSFTSLTDEIVNDITYTQFNGNEYVALATNAGVQLFEIIDSNDASTFTIQSAQIATTNVVQAISLVSDGTLYFGEKNVGLHRAQISSATFASDLTGALTTDRTYNSNAGQGSLTTLDFSDIDVLKDSSLTTGENLIVIATNNGLSTIHENVSQNTSESRHFTYKGAGQEFFGKVAEFDGVNDHIKILDKASTPDDAGTMDFWFRTDTEINSSLITPKTLVYKGTGGNGSVPQSTSGNWTLRFESDGKLAFYLGLGIFDTPLKVQSSTNEWYAGTQTHIRVSWEWTNGTDSTPDTSDDELQASIWVNGVLEGGTTIVSGDRANFAANTAPIFIGGADSNADGIADKEFFKGALDEFFLGENAANGGDFVSNFVPPSQPYSDGTSNYPYTGAGSEAVTVLHFDSIWDSGSTTYGVAVDSSANSPENASYRSGATNTLPILSGLSRELSSVRGVADSSNPTIMGLTKDGLTELLNARDAVPAVGQTSNLDGVGMDVYHVNSPTSSDIVLLRRNTSVINIRR